MRDYISETHIANEKAKLFASLVRCIYKPDSVPILSTAGGYRIENPELVEGSDPSNYSGRSILQLPAAGKIGGNHVSGMSVATHLKRLFQQ